MRNVRMSSVCDTVHPCISACAVLHSVHAALIHKAVDLDHTGQQTV